VIMPRLLMLNPFPVLLICRPRSGVKTQKSRHDPVQLEPVRAATLPRKKLLLVAVRWFAHPWAALLFSCPRSMRFAP